MAQLKDTIVIGDVSVTGTLYSSKIQGNTLWIPTVANGTTYGAGTSGQILKTNGTTIYWANDTNSDTTYTFEGGTNSFTVTPSGGLAQTVTIIPAITNNITGSGTSGYLTKFNGANTITKGPQLGSNTTTFLRNDGNWATPINTTYSAGTGLSLSNTTFNHSNSVTAKTTQALYPITFDTQGHITGAGTAVIPLTSHQTIKQDGITGAIVNRFGTCSTVATQAAKTVSVTTGTFALEAGSMVTVKFSNANTANNPTLNVGSSGAKNIFHRGVRITTGANKALLSGVVLFVYDGTQWHLIDGNYVVASTTSVGSASAGTAISADDITAWTTNIPTSVTKKTVVTSASGATAAYSAGIITFTNGSFSTGDSVTVTAGTAASLSYTSRSIPNISVISTTVADGVTLS